ncbi:MAG: hypothetical protein L3J54_00885, partial [Draconibacterium sp.]|nr:hypothetical protein [Draconibacterium sp.]
RVSEITREWMSGSVSDLNQTDDTMRITGYVISTFNINEIEVVYRKDIIVPLIKTSGCRYFSSGVIEITQNGIVVTKLSYGDGDCDNVAILMETGKNAVEIVLSENDDYFNKGSKITSEMTGDHQNQGSTMGHDSTYTDNENHNSGMSQDSTNTNNKNHESENKKQGHGGSNRD